MQDRIEAGSNSQRLADEFLAGFTPETPMSLQAVLAEAFDWLEERPLSSKPEAQDGLVGELRALAINVNADIPDETARNRYVSALHAAATALASSDNAQAKREAYEEGVNATLNYLLKRTRDTLAKGEKE